MREGEAEHPHLGRYRLRQDDNAERAFVVRPGRRADRHDRGCGRAPAPAGSRDHARVAPSEHRGLGRDPHPRARPQLPAHAPRPDHRRRGPRPRDPGHAPGDEHGPRGLAHDDPREHAARLPRPPRDAGHDGRRRAAAPRHPRADLERLRRARADLAPRRRLAPRHAHHRGAPDGVGRDHAAGPVRRQGAGRGDDRHHPWLAAAPAALVHGPEAALPREDGGQRGHPAADVLPRGSPRRPYDVQRGAVRRRAVKRFLALAVLCASLPAVASAASPEIASLDTAGYPTVRATVVTPKPVATAPSVTENGRPVVGFRAVNIGREKSVMLVFDRSQSMIGQAIRDASAAARQFVGSKPVGDRIAVVAVGKKAVQLTSFSSNPAEADAALRTIEGDEVRGTALYDGILVATQALAADVNPTRVLILLTDGQEVSSDASLEQAIASAREAHVTVYPIGIESPSFRPAPLQRLAEKTGGRYAGASGTKDLRAIYAALASELRRTWQVSYVTAARPGERLEVEAAGATAESVVPGVATPSTAVASKLPEQFYKVGPLVMTTIVGFLILLAALFVLRAPIGSRLRRQIKPHLGEQKRKQARGPVQERFATASSLMRATEKAFGHLGIWHALHRLLERADVPLRTVELVYAAGGSGLFAGIVFAVAGAASFVTLIAMVAGAAVPIAVVWLKA